MLLGTERPGVRNGNVRSETTHRAPGATDPAKNEAHARAPTSGLTARCPGSADAALTHATKPKTPSAHVASIRLAQFLVGLLRMVHQLRVALFRHEPASDSRSLPPSLATRPPKPTS
jgi:hypothetical protein